MDKEFPISNYPLEQTEFLYDSKLGTVDFFIIIYAHIKSCAACHMLKWPKKIDQKREISSKMKETVILIIQCSISGWVYYLYV